MYKLDICNTGIRLILTFNSRLFKDEQYAMCAQLL